MCSAAAAFVVGAGCFGAGRAGAVAAAPPISDPASIGGLALFDASGAPLTNGGDTSGWARFVVAGNSTASSSAPVVLSVATVDPSEAPAAWSVTTLTGGAGSTPAAAAPAGLPATLLPLAGMVLDAGDSQLARAVSADKGATTLSQPVLVQLRLSDSTRADARYWSTYLEVDPATDTWKLVPTSTSPVAPVLGVPTQASAGNGVITVTGAVAAATDGTRPTGWVELFDGTVDRGAAAYDPTTGTLVAKDLPRAGQPAYHFVFTPADSVDYKGTDSSSGAAVATTSPTATSMPPPSQAASGTGGAQLVDITVTVTPPAGAMAYGNTLIAAKVAPADAHGTVLFSEAGAFSATVPVADGDAALTTNSLGAGTHVLSATFTSSDDRYSTASATSAPFALVAPSSDRATGTLSATVPAGQLTLTTPYGPGHPLELGDLALAPAGSQLVATAHIGTAATAAKYGITITDTRVGDPGWSASLVSGDLTNGSYAISAQNLGFVNVHSVPVPGYGGGGLGTAQRPVITRDLPSSNLVQSPNSTGSAGLADVPKVFASAVHGKGTVYIYGDLRLQAPTSALSGEYTAALAFTVS